MPWVKEELCTGCEICVDECTVGAISMRDGIAFVDDGECIRCGVCHDICPNDAVRHDSEQIPLQVGSNMAWVEQLLAHGYYAGDRERQRGLIGRLERHFVKERTIAERTIERLHALRDSE